MTIAATCCLECCPDSMPCAAELYDDHRNGTRPEENMIANSVAKQAQRIHHRAVLRPSRPMEMGAHPPPPPPRCRSCKGKGRKTLLARTAHRRQPHPLHGLPRRRRRQAREVRSGRSEAENRTGGVLGGVAR